jgi:hypothetical protein
MVKLNVKEILTAEQDVYALPNTRNVIVKKTMYGYCKHNINFLFSYGYKEEKHHFY